MKTLRFYIVIAIVISFTYACTMPQRDCQNVREGEYYFNPKQSPKKYLLVRTAAIQKEIEINTHDTAYWKLKWLTDCKFTLEFSHRVDKITPQEKRLLKSHKVVVEIMSVAQDYYIGRYDLDALTSKSVIDTFWVKK